MSTIEESIDVRAPVSAASEQWGQFDSFPSDTEVTFIELDEHRTRVIVHMAYEPRTLNRPVGNMLGIADFRMTDELESFKEFIEQRAA